MKSYRDQLVRLHSTGMDDHAIAADLGKSVEAVQAVRRRLGLSANRELAAIPEHGTDNRYVHYGCRCQACKIANTQRQRKLRTRRKALNVDQIPHGLGGAVNYGCRCDVCRRAVSARNREYRCRPLAEDQHGRSANAQRGCRCAECVAYVKSHRNPATLRALWARRRRGPDYADWHRRWMKRTNDASTDTARNYGKEWTGPEMELLLRDDLTAKKLSVMLGRTVYAVRNKRAQIRRDPRAMFLAGLLPGLQVP